MKILLGIFKNSLYLLDTYPDLNKYPFNLLDSEIDIYEPISTVKKAVDKANKIIFCLDGLIFPINYNIYTYKELLYIVNDRKILKKTQFILNGKFIKREIICEQIKYKNNGKFEFVFDKHIDKS